MIEVATAHTAELDAATLAAARALCDNVFGEELTDDDWEHGLGGIHALAREGGELVGHGSVVQRRLLHGGRALRAGYLEGVAVRANRRGRGYGAAVVDALEGVVRGAYDLGALSGTDASIPFYEARGWQQWQGPTAVLAPDGLMRTEEDDGGVYVLPGAAPLDLNGQLACDWRDGEVW